MVVKILRFENYYHFNSKGDNVTNDRFHIGFTITSELILVANHDGAIDEKRAEHKPFHFYFL